MSTTYAPASDKPNKLLTGFISVRVPELKYIYGSLLGPTSVTEVTKKFGRPDATGVRSDHVEETLRFLNAVDLVESPSGDIRDTVIRINDGQFAGLPFEARLLYHCTRQEGRQRHFADLHRVLMNQGTRIVSADRDDILTSLRRATEYDFSWTDEKVNMWVILTQQVGLITETDDGLVMSPCRALTHDALRLAPSSPGADPEYGDLPIDNVGFRHALDWIHENLFAVYLDRSGTPRVHPAVADVLENMGADDVLTMSAPGDARNNVKLPAEDLDSDAIGNRRTVTHLSLRARPDEPAYQYPLEQSLPPR
jgi:hypothetical protein